MPRLVVDDGEPALSQLIDPIDAALHHDSRQRSLTGHFRREGPPSNRSILSLHLHDPVDRFEKPRCPQRAQHWVNGIVFK